MSKEEVLLQLGGKIRELKKQLAQMEGIVGTIAVRSEIDNIFLNKIKKFPLVKKLGQRYTSKQIRNKNLFLVIER